MTFQLIHDRGRVIRIEQRAFVDTTEARSTIKHRPRGTWKGWREVKLPKSHNGYKPGPIYDLGADQCRFIWSDEDHIMCGAKVQTGSSYCPSHHARCHVRKEGNRE
jgi:hypothetical protein